MSVSREETQPVSAPAPVDSRVRGNDEGSVARVEENVARVEGNVACVEGSVACVDGPSVPQAAGMRRNDERSMAYRAWEFWVKRSWMLWVLAALVLLLDQSTKSIIIAWLDWGESWPAEGFLRITHARNTGTAFSLFQGHSNVLSIVALFAVAVLLWVYATTGAKSFVLRFALGLQLGGALGNLLDRLQLGYVTDFIDVGPWPIFNVADSAISIGMVLMISYFVMTRNEEIDISAASTVAEVPASGCPSCASARRYGTLHRDDFDVPQSEIRS